MNLNESSIKVVDSLKESTGELLIQSLFSFVSTGTERLIVNGQVPGSLKENMKVPFMEGSFDFPLKYGYSLVGKVIEGNQALLGRIVHLMCPHQDFAIVPETNISLVPESLSAQRAVLASNAETALNAVWDSSISVGDKVLICGFGIIGALIAIISKQIPATRIVVCEKDNYRKQIASTMGFEILNAEKNLNTGFDLAFNTSASEEGLQLCIDSTLTDSKIIEVSWYGINKVRIELGTSFHTGQKQIIASQVSTIPLKKQAHYNFIRRKQLVFELLHNPMIGQLPFQLVQFNDLPKVFDQFRKQDYKEFATIVKY